VAEAWSASDADAAARRLGEQLRQVRRQQDLSLHDVEVLSEGRFKASVVGAYERGERSLSVERLHQLAEFYRVGVDELLPRSPAPPPVPGELSVVIDLVALERRRDVQPVLARYVDAIRERRGDHDARVLTLRERDLVGLAAAEGMVAERLAAQLRAQGVLR
jgi:transcriptional regulator with XRE-family HTH domain